MHNNIFKYQSILRDYVNIDQNVQSVSKLLGQYSGVSSPTSKQGKEFVSIYVRKQFRYGPHVRPTSIVYILLSLWTHKNPRVFSSNLK
jgi:hypothetical protein